VTIATNAFVGWYAVLKYNTLIFIRLCVGNRTWLASKGIMEVLEIMSYACQWQQAEYSGAVIAETYCVPAAYTDKYQDMLRICPLLFW
jgi:hypothetical protein